MEPLETTLLPWAQLRAGVNIARLSPENPAGQPAGSWFSRLVRGPRYAGRPRRDRGTSRGFRGSRQVLHPARGERAGWSSLFDDLARRTRTRPETTGEAGDGVWAIYTISADGGARVEEVYASELDALRANQSNIDVTRKVRFLPYGIAVSVLDDSN